MSQILYLIPFAKNLQKTCVQCEKADFDKQGVHNNQNLVKMYNNAGRAQTAISYFHIIMFASFKLNREKSCLFFYLFCSAL